MAAVAPAPSPAGRTKPSFIDDPANGTPVGRAATKSVVVDPGSPKSTAGLFGGLAAQAHERRKTLKKRDTVGDALKDLARETHLKRLKEEEARRLEEEANAPPPIGSFVEGNNQSFSGTFAKRWEMIGSPPSTAQSTSSEASSPSMVLPKRPTFVGLASSLKLCQAGDRAWEATLKVEAERLAAVTGGGEAHVAALWALPTSKPRGPQGSQRRIEAGSPLRLLDEDLGAMRISEDRFKVENVTAGLAKLRSPTGPAALVRQSKARRSVPVPEAAAAAVEAVVAKRRERPRRKSIPPAPLDSPHDAFGSGQDISQQLADCVVVQAPQKPNHDGYNHKLAAAVVDMDSIEAHHFEVEAETSVLTPRTLSKAKEQILKRLRKEDAVVAQFMEFLLTSFSTLRTAFRTLDANGTGALTKPEFMESLSMLKTTTGLRLQDAHESDLFSRIDVGGTGAIAIEGLVEMTQPGDDSGTGDELLRRLGGFFQETTTSAAHIDSVVVSSTAYRDGLRRAFHKREGESLTCVEFMETLERLGYREWHTLDLFDRIDVDASQTLALGEFVSLLEKDPMPGFVVPKGRPKGPGLPPGSSGRRRLLMGAHSMCAFSPKLARQDSRAASSPKPKQFIEGNLCGATIAWRSEELGFSLRCERPDFPDLVRKGIGLSQAKSGSSLVLNGLHKIRGHPERPKDLAELSTAMASFDDSHSRDRTQES